MSLSVDYALLSELLGELQKASDAAPVLYVYMSVAGEQDMVKDPKRGKGSKPRKMWIHKFTAILTGIIERVPEYVVGRWTFKHVLGVTSTAEPNKEVQQNLAGQRAIFNRFFAMLPKGAIPELADWKDADIHRGIVGGLQEAPLQGILGINMQPVLDLLQEEIKAQGENAHADKGAAPAAGAEEKEKAPADSAG